MYCFQLTLPVQVIVTAYNYCSQWMTDDDFDPIDHLAVYWVPSLQGDKPDHNGKMYYLPTYQLIWSK